MLDGVQGATTVDSGVDVVKDATTVPPPAPPFSPRSAHRGRWRYTMAATGDGVDGSPQSHAVVDVIKGGTPTRSPTSAMSTPTAPRTSSTPGTARTAATATSCPSPTRSSATTSTATGGGGPYFEFWGGVPHYYSYDVGGWHVAVIDTNTEYAQTAVGSAQYDWLDADLAAHQSACTIVMQHQPRYAEAPGDRSYLQDLWSQAYYRGVTLLLTGHVHKYQRWTPMDQAATRSPAD